MYRVYFIYDGINRFCRFDTLEDAADFVKLSGGKIVKGN